MFLNITVIYGSVRTERQGIKAARFIVNKLKERGHKVTLIDPLEYKLPIIDYMYKEYKQGTAPEVMQKLAKIFIDSDAFVIMAAEYNSGIPPALKNILDHFQKEFFYRPSALVSYSAGFFGGLRGVMAYRAILADLGMPAIPSVFPVSQVQAAFNEQGKALDKNYERRVKKFLDELEWYAKTFRDGRGKYSIK